MSRDAWLEYAAVATGRTVDDCRRLLAAERKQPGVNVATEIERRGIEPHVWSDALVDFYKESDAFVFELLDWNTRPFKRSMRAWSRNFLRREQDRLGRPLRVLCHGDGLGLDAAAFAGDGHDVTYFEFPGPSERFARRLFAGEGHAVDVLIDATKVAGGFDVVTSFDVLEHVPDPRATAGEFARLLRDPGGVLLVHAPFYLILPPFPTHLRSSRRHAGSTRLYERHGFRLIDGNRLWHPLALRLRDETGRAPAAKLAMIRLVGQAMKVGRATARPFALPVRLLR
jgi:SAM-dependent methyltransferase